MPQTDTPHIFKDETNLMQVIQQQQPIIDRPRLEELRNRCEYGHLSPEEHQDLMQYEDELERHNADRGDGCILTMQPDRPTCLFIC
jgi:hypothetical protein